MESEYDTDSIDQQNNVRKRTRRKPANKICVKCNKVFPYAYNCRRHMKTCKFPDVKGTFKCSECLGEFYCSDMYFAHLPLKHPDVVIKKHKFEFETHEEFYLWKLKMEKQTASFFKKDYHYKRTLTKVKVVDRYHCHRSGAYVSRGTGKHGPRGKGTNKCGFYCPAMFTRSVEATGCSFVLYQSTHLGHKCEGRLFPQTEKSRNTRQCGALRQSSRKKSSNEAARNEEFRSFSLGDLETSFDPYPKPEFLSNLKSVNKYVGQLMSCGSNPILLFKGYGEENANFPDLESSDLILGFMNLVQERVLTMYGNDVVLVDSNGGLPTTLLVKGPDGRGFPVAFLWCTNPSESVFRSFFGAILERGCYLDCQTLVSRHDSLHYTAWSTVFGPPKAHLLCESELVWAENASVSIQVPERRREVLSVLSYMQRETDTETFECSLKINSAFWLEDVRTARFGRWFAVNFSRIANMWAACYRDTSTLEMDDILEDWHDHLYEIDRKVESEDSIEQTLYYIMKSKRELLLHQIISLNHSRQEQCLEETRKSHKLAKGMFESGLSLHCLGEGVWAVPSFTQKGVVYKVRSLNPEPHNCDMNCYDCDSCLHQFSCSCTDSIVKLELCRHIHLVCLFHQTPELDLCRQTSDLCIASLRLKAQNALLQFWPCLDTLDSENALREVIQAIEILQMKFERK